MSDDQFIKLTQEQMSILENIEKIINDKDLPDSYPSFINQSRDSRLFALRGSFINLMGFVLLSKDWIKDLSQWVGNRRCLEVMAGLGALSYGLRKQGVEIIATDDYSWKKENEALSHNRMWIHIEALDAVESIEKYGRTIEIIIMSWPPYNDEIAIKVLRKMREVNPSCIMIYIGEEEGGCTANDEFFRNIEIIEDKFFNAANQNFISWSLINDRPILIR